MPSASQPADEVVGVRFTPRGPLTWYRAGSVVALVRSWVVVEQAGRPQVGQVIVGRGQCLEFPAAVEALPVLLRAAETNEVPLPIQGEGKRLLDSLP